MITKIEGQLEIHHERGVIYFHSAEKGWSVLRICRLPPIPDVSERQLDITHMVGCDFGTITEKEKETRNYDIEKRMIGQFE